MEIEQVRKLRSFNRVVTQRVGALDDSFLGRGRPLGEARLLFEIGAAGSEARALRERLGLDSGYLSRLLGSLEAQGLIQLRPSAEDRRVRHISLTATGLSEVSAYNARSDALAEGVLAPLSPVQRARLVAAMAEVERLMRASSIVVAPQPSDSAEAQWCLEQYFAEIAARFEAGFDPRRSPSPSRDETTPPNGVFLVASLEGRPVGCGGVRMSGEIGEIKRLWVGASVRGLGLGRRLLAELEERAAEFGAKTYRLDTNRALTEARALYQSAGYVEIPRFNDEPHAHHWFEKKRS